MLPSPAPSAATASTSSYLDLAKRPLPHPRSKPLRPGFKKYEETRRWAEARLAHIMRRFVKKYGEARPGDDIVAYRGLDDLGADVEEVIDTLWLSGTPALQVQFLLTIANDSLAYLGSFPKPDPSAAMSVLAKLDHCFASLLLGVDIDTREPLPGFEAGLSAGMSVTDMVRCRGIAERSRFAVSKVLLDDEDDESEDEEEKKNGSSGEDEDGEETQELSSDAAAASEERTEVAFEVARVYVRTLEALAERLGGLT